VSKALIKLCDVIIVPKSNVSFVGLLKDGAAYFDDVGRHFSDALRIL